MSDGLDISPLHSPHARRPTMFESANMVIGKFIMAGVRLCPLDSSIFGMYMMGNKRARQLQFRPTKYRKNPLFNLLSIKLLKNPSIFSFAGPLSLLLVFSSLLSGFLKSVTTKMAIEARLASKNKH